MTSMEQSALPLLFLYDILRRVEELEFSLWASFLVLTGSGLLDFLQDLRAGQSVGAGQSSELRSHTCSGMESHFTLDRGFSRVCAPRTSPLILTNSGGVSPFGPAGPSIVAVGAILLLLTWGMRIPATGRSHSTINQEGS